MQKQHGAGWRVLQAIIGIFVAIWSLLPIYWAFVVAVSRPSDLTLKPVSIIPRSFSLDNFANLLVPSVPTARAFLAGFTNSVIQATGTTVVTLLIALPASYAFARIHFRGSTTVLAIITATFAIPVYLVLIPLFQLGAATSQLNTQQFVILVLVSASLPLAIWILRSHISSLPQDIESAARLDGANTFVLIRSIIGPLIAPGLVAAAVVVFLGAWGAFLIPLVYAGAQGAQPVTVVIPTFATQFSNNYGLKAAAGLLAVLPPLLLVVALRRHLLAGLISGAIR